MLTQEAIEVTELLVYIETKFKDRSADIAMDRRKQPPQLRQPGNGKRKIAERLPRPASDGT